MQSLAVTLALATRIWCHPLSHSIRSDWPTNVVMLAGPQNFGMFVPVDGQVHDLSSIQCLDLPSYAIGACSDISVDQIGLSQGVGPCTFYGSNGLTITILGNTGAGYQTIAPPQTMQQVVCIGST